MGPGAAIMDAMTSNEHSRIKWTTTLIIPKLDEKSKGFS
jgi:hypothetical protein